nr:DUF6483 family protein [Tissierella sp.]
MYQQDWLMRQIESITNMIAKFIFKKERVDYEIVEIPHFEATNFLYKKLLALLNEGRINEAENLLFKSLDKTNLNYLSIGLDFYSRLNKFTDEELETFNFSRGELKKGLEDLGQVFGVSPMFSLIDK